MAQKYILYLSKFNAACRLFLDEDKRLRFRKNSAVPAGIQGAVVPTTHTFKDVKKTINMRTSYAFNHILQWMCAGDILGRDTDAYRNITGNIHGRILEDISAVAPIDLPLDDVESLVREHVEIYNEHIERDVYSGKSLLEHYQRHLRQDYRLVRDARNQCMSEVMHKVENALKRKHHILLMSAQPGQIISPPTTQDAIDYTAALFGTPLADTQKAVLDATMRKQKHFTLLPKVDKRSIEYRALRDALATFKQREIMRRKRERIKHAQKIVDNVSHAIVMSPESVVNTYQIPLPEFKFKIEDLLTGEHMNEVPDKCPVLGLTLWYMPDGVAEIPTSAVVEKIDGADKHAYTADNVKVVSALASLLIDGPSRKYSRYSRAVEYVCDQQDLVDAWNNWLTTRAEGYEVYTAALFYKPKKKEEVVPPPPPKEKPPMPPAPRTRETDVWPDAPEISKARISVKLRIPTIDPDELQENNA